MFYNWHRSYDPRTGRYTQPDPIGLAGGWNRFVYVENNPIGATDSLGLKAGDKYPTPEKAVRDAFKEARPLTKRTMHEHGGVIYQFPDGSYSYTGPLEGISIAVATGDCPPSTKLVADWHTHAIPNRTYSETFSPTDIRGSEEEQLPGYLLTVSGRMKLYDPQRPAGRKIINLGRIK